MADYNTMSEALYNSDTDERIPPSGENPSVLTTSDTDDGYWNVGDNNWDGRYTYQGYYETGGHLFLVLEGDSFNSILSPTASAFDSGYPDSFPDHPPLNTEPLALCFAAGSLIATPQGEVPVEKLMIGDTVLTADGREVPVKWIGRQTLHKIIMGERYSPVRVKAGALGDGLPHTDLTLTADHALMLDGLAINAGTLVNGTTIDYVPRSELSDQETYYHIEAENHDVILANGTPAETYVNYVGRTKFDNFAEYIDLYGYETRIAEMPAIRISSGRHVPQAIRDRLNIKDGKPKHLDELIAG